MLDGRRDGSSLGEAESSLPAKRVIRRFKIEMIGHRVQCGWRDAPAEIGVVVHLEDGEAAVVFPSRPNILENINAGQVHALLEKVF